VTGPREQLEAESWQGRRLVAAYLTGSADASTGSRGRLLAVGLALAATAVAVALGLAHWR
jgi:hypothetical protein